MRARRSRGLDVSATRQSLPCENDAQKISLERERCPPTPCSRVFVSHSVWSCVQGHWIKRFKQTREDLSSIHLWDRRTPPRPSDGCPSTCRQSVARVAKMSRDVAKMSPRCRGRVAVCRASVAGGSRHRRGLSRRHRGLSRCRRGGSPCRKVSRGVAGTVSRAGRRLSRRRHGLLRRCRGRVAVCRAAVTVCRAVVAGGSPPVAPPSRSVVGCRRCRGPSFFCQTRDMYLETHRRGGVGGYAGQNAG